MRWDGNAAHWEMAGGMGFDNAMSGSAKLQGWQWDRTSIPTNLDFKGDWIYRSGASQRDVLAGIAQVLSERLGRTVRFEQRTLPRQAIVMRGAYAFHALPGRQAEVIDLTDADPGAPPSTGPAEKETDSFVYRGTLIDMLNFAFANDRHVIDEAGVGKRNVAWRWRPSLRSQEKLLKNLAAQTSLQLDSETRDTPVWVLVDEKGNPAATAWVAATRATAK